MTPGRVRREAAPFRPVHVARVVRRSPHMVRVTLAGAALEGLPVGLPTGSVRLLLPPAGATEVVLPTWNGNEFRDADGARPVIRSYTPLRFDADALELDVDIVLHPEGAVAAWAATVGPGAPSAVSGTGRGYAIDPGVERFVLAGDEAALPAIGVLLEALPPSAEVQVLAEVARPDARLTLPAHPRAAVRWMDLPPGAPPGATLVAAMEAVPLEASRVWAAGEAAAMQRLRLLLFSARSLPRSEAWVRGYWKLGARGDADEG